MNSSASIEEQARQLLISIKAQRKALDIEAKRIRTPEILDAFDKWDHECWCLSAIGDSLVRLRLFTEHNFEFIETIGVISVSRYIFELSVWLELFKIDPRYGLVYYAQLIDTQYRYWKDYRAQLDREVSMLKTFELEEKDLLREALSQVRTHSDPVQQQQVAFDVASRVAELIDKKAARYFSIYAGQAKVNGYGFQAHLIEKKAVPEIERSLADLRSAKDEFFSSVPESIQKLIPNRWNWRQMAEKAGLVDEYDFIYTFSSKLLHATPASITTDQKNLELSELVVFLKYISVKISDFLEIAEGYPASAA
jgi:hypothetical protein